MREILKYTLKLTVVGPMHIGNGEKLDKCDYVFFAPNVYVVDPQKMFMGLKKLGLVDDFINVISRKDRSKDKGKSRDRNKVEDGLKMIFEEELNLKHKVYNEWVKYKCFVPSDIGPVKNQIACFIKDAYGKPYIPGSSVKGAIRNAVLNSVLLREPKKRAPIAQKVKDLCGEKTTGKKGYLSDESRELDELFRTLDRTPDKPLDMLNDIFAGLRIGDSEPILTDCLTVCQKVDKYPKKRPAEKMSQRNMPLFRECLRSTTVVKFPVTIDTSVFPYDAEKLCECIRDMYKMEQERFLSAFPGVYSDRFSDGRSTLLYLGGGTGFVSKTAAYPLFDDEDTRLDVVSTILHAVDSEKNGQKIGKHKFDKQDYGVTPHLRKITVSSKNEYDLGLCKVEFERVD